ncbi:hypothetical protein LTR62_003348 [Meristemomyces frigidus]|uniref:Uncharacterized protein n=1 Tax=Meristemomyces frigidus TaxID=1508187 RepID=A0AAN7YKP0_9PEZI|nr:hypothetical protein LTR62_003348 [Meristemomyces frigidus]
MPTTSIFSYPATRNYPFKWFSFVAIAGFLIASILFSFLNYVSTGYALVNEEASNPNTTVSGAVWMRRWPSFLTSKVRPSCEPTDIQVGTEFFTDQTALSYTLTDVWQLDQGGAGAGYGVGPALTYYNNVMQNCSVDSVEIDYAAMDRTASQFAYSEWGAVEYDYVPSGLSSSKLYTFLGTNFLSRNKTTKSSLFWGGSLMSVYWTSSTFQMQTIRENQTINDLPAIRKGTLYFYPNDDATVTNMTDPNFFECDYRFTVDKGTGNYDVIFPSTYGEYRSETRLSSLIEQQAYTNIWQGADALAKAAYATILTDLGQDSGANLLVDLGSLRYFTANVTELRRPLGTTASVISSKYLCQVPQRKPGRTLFVSILVADVVFLQALWFLFVNAVDFFLLRRHRERNHCEGCMGDLRMRNLAADEMPLTKEGAEVEMGGLRLRDEEERERSVSRSRLIGMSIDINDRGREYRDIS